MTAASGSSLQEVHSRLPSPVFTPPRSQRCTSATHMRAASHHDDIATRTRHTLVSSPFLPMAVPTHGPDAPTVRTYPVGTSPANIGSGAGIDWTASSATDTHAYPPAHGRAADVVFSLAPVTGSAGQRLSASSENSRVHPHQSTYHPRTEDSAAPVLRPQALTLQSVGSGSDYTMAPSPAFLSGRDRGTRTGAGQLSDSVATGAARTSVHQGTKLLMHRRPPSSMPTSAAPRARLRPESPPRSVASAARSLSKPLSSTSASLLARAPSAAHAQGPAARKVRSHYRLSPRSVVPSPSRDSTAEAQPTNAPAPPNVDPNTRARSAVECPITTETSAARDTRRPTTAHRSGMHADTPQGRFESGMAAYRYYQTKARQCQPSPGTNCADGAMSRPLASVSTLTRSVEDTDDEKEGSVLGGCDTGHHSRPLRTTFTATTTAQVLRFSSDDEDATAVLESGPASTVAANNHSRPEASQTITRALMFSQSERTPHSSSLVRGACDDLSAQAQKQREEAEYAARRRVRSFEDKYHSPRLHPTATPLLDALLSQVGADYFQARPPPLLVRNEHRVPSAAAASVQQKEERPGATELGEIAPREGYVELSAWLQLRETRLGAANSDSAVLVESDARKARLPPPVQANTCTNCDKTCSSDGKKGGAADESAAEAARTRGVRVHVDRVLTALARSHETHVGPGHRIAAEHTPTSRPCSARRAPRRRRGRPHRELGASPASSSRSSSCSFSSTPSSLSEPDSGEDTEGPEALAASGVKTCDAGAAGDSARSAIARGVKARVPLPQRLAQCLRGHAPLAACVARTARLVVYSLMRTLPAALYVGDPADFSTLEALGKDGLTSLLRRIEQATPHSCLQRAQQRILDFVHRGGPASRHLSSETVWALCRTEWESLSASASQYIPVLCSPEALTWLLLPDGLCALSNRTSVTTLGVGRVAGEESHDSHRSHPQQECRSIVRDDPVCRVLWLLLGCRSSACAALATVLEDTYVHASTSAVQARARLSSGTPLPSVPSTATNDNAGDGVADTRTQHWLMQQDVAELVQWLRAAAEEGGHLTDSSRHRALHVFYASLGRTGARDTAPSSRDLRDLIFAPCSFLTLAAAILLHVSDAPAQVTGGPTTTTTSTTDANAPPGRPRCLHPHLVDSHGGYGQAPFTGEVRQYMREKEDLVRRLLDIASTNTDGLARDRQCQQHETDIDSSCDPNHATTKHTDADRSNAVDNTSTEGLSSLNASHAFSASDAMSNVSGGPHDARSCEADRQAHYAYLHAALQPSFAYLPLEGVHHLLSCSVAAKAKVPLEWAVEDVGPAELALLLDLMHSFSHLSMSLSSSRKAALYDAVPVKKPQGRAKPPCRRAPRVENKDTLPPVSVPPTTEEEDAEAVDTFFFEFHRQTLLKWCAVVCSEAATDYAMELVGPGLAGFSFATYDTTTELSDSQCDAIMASPLAALTLPSTLILPDSRHLASIVLERCRRVVLEAVVQLKGEVMFLLTGVDSRDRLLAVHRATLLGVQRAVDARRQQLWMRRKHRQTAVNSRSPARGAARTAKHPAADRDDAQGEVKSPSASTTVSVHTAAPLALSINDDVDDTNHGSDEDGSQASSSLWALDAARAALSAAVKKSAAHVLERTFLASPLYSRDGTHVVASVADIISPSSLPDKLSHSRTHIVPHLTPSSPTSANGRRPPGARGRGEAASEADERNDVPCQRTPVRHGADSHRPRALTPGQSPLSVNKSTTTLRAPSPPHELAVVVPSSPYARPTSRRHRTSLSALSSSSPSTVGGALDASFPDDLRLDAVYELMYAMEKARLVSNSENKLFNGELAGTQGAGGDFNPLGPQWRRATPASTKNASSIMPLFPKSTVTRATVSNAAAVPAVRVAKVIARAADRAPTSDALRPSSSPSRGRLASRPTSNGLIAENSRPSTGRGGRDDGTSEAALPPHPSQSKRATLTVSNEALSHAADVQPVGPSYGADEAVLAAIRGDVNSPCPCSSWFELGKGHVENLRLAAQHRRPDTDHMFDLNSVSPLVALTTCVLPTPTLAPPSTPRSPSQRQTTLTNGVSSQRTVCAEQVSSVTEAGAEGVPTKQSHASPAATSASAPRRSRPLSRTTASCVPAIRHNPFLVRPATSPGAMHPPSAPRGASPISAGRQLVTSVRSRLSVPQQGVPSHRIGSGAAFAPTQRPGVRADAGEHSPFSRPATSDRLLISASGSRWPSPSRGRMGTLGTAAMAPVNTRSQGTRVSMRERLGFRVGEHLMPWTS